MTEITRYEAQAPVGGNPAHVRLGINQIATVANYFAESGLFSITEKNQVSGRFEPRPMRPQECFAIIMAGQSLGLGPMPSMMSFHIIEGRPEMSANLQAHFLKASDRYDYRMHFVYADDGEVNACHVDVIDKRLGEVVGESVFTRAMAQKAGLIRERGNWMKYAESMLFARAISNAVAWHAPDCVPMRIYSDGEMSGPKPNGVEAVAGEGPPSPARVEQIVADALAASDDEEEVVAAADVVVEPGTQETVGTEETAQDAEVVSRETGASEDIEGRLREDIPKLPPEEKQFIKATIEERRWEFKVASILRLMGEQGKTTIGDWLAWAHSPEGFQANVTASAPTSGPPAAEEEAQLPAGVTGRETGSQTAPTVSDAQMGMLHARFSECAFTDAEKRTFLRRYAQCESTRQVKRSDVDDLLEVLRDIKDGDDATRRAYVGGDE